jgi:hypothetical protein
MVCVIWSLKGMGTAWERHGICDSVFKRHGNGMVCVIRSLKGMGTAWEQHGNGMVCVIRFLKGMGTARYV